LSCGLDPVVSSSRNVFIFTICFSHHSLSIISPTIRGSTTSWNSELYPFSPLDLVSEIIPAYNAEKYLKESIGSALNQTYKNIEIIVVNDGSTDNSLKILDKFSDKIKIISKSNGGTASAFNLAIKNMEGEWFKWLSADNVLHSNAVEELIKESQKIKDKKNAILYSNYDIINSEGKIIKQFIEPDYNKLSTFDFNVILLDHHIGNGY